MHYFRYITTFLIAVSSFLLVPGEVRADYTYTIDFETDKDGATPTDDAAITAQTYAYTHQDLTITFEGNYVDDNVGNSNLAFEDYGYSATNSSASSELKSGYNFATSAQPGYPSSFPSGPDSIASGYESQAGDFFMRSGAPINIIRIANSASGSPVSGASGEIWDIDGDFGGAGVSEAYNVYAYSISGSDYTLLAKQLSSDGGTQGDSTPWSWSFSGLTDGIDAIVVYQAGKNFTSNAPSTGWTTGNGVGMTGSGFWNDDVGTYTQAGTVTTSGDANYMINFDNLSFTVTPEPNSILAVGGVASLAFLRRRRRPRTVARDQE